MEKITETIADADYPAPPSELDILQVRIGEMAAEVDRLNAEREQLMAQKPVAYFVDVEYCGFTRDIKNIPEVYKNDITPLYAQAVPAQQAKEPRGTNEYGLDVGYMAGKLNLFLRDIDRHTPDEAARVLARLAKVANEQVLAESEFVQPSPVGAISKTETTTQSTAVAVPDEGELRRIFEEYYADDRFPIRRDAFGDYFESDQRGRTLNNDWEEWKRCQKAMLNIVSNQAAMPSPRITEQDAREIVCAFLPYWESHDIACTASECFDYWVVTGEFIALLNKLNDKGDSRFYEYCAIGRSCEYVVVDGDDGEPCAQCRYCGNDKPEGVGG